MFQANTNDAYICNQLNGLLLNMLRLDFEAVKSIPKTRSAKAVDYIHNHYMEDISVNQLAEILYVSPYICAMNSRMQPGKRLFSI